MLSDSEKQEGEIRKLVPKKLDIPKPVEKVVEEERVVEPVQEVEPLKSVEPEVVVVEEERAENSVGWILWFFGAGILFFGAFWGVSAFLDGSEKGVKPKVEESKVKLVDRTKEYQSDPKLREIVKMQNEIFETLAEGILYAQTVDELLPYLRHGEKMRGEVERTWKPWVSGKTNWSPRSKLSMVPIMKDGSLLQVIARVQLENGKTENFVFVRIGGKTLLDWDATTASRNDEVFSENPKLEGEHVVRVMASVDCYYPLPFLESKYQCFLLDTPNREKFVWGYVARNTAVDGLLLERFAKHFVLPNSLTYQPMTLLVRHLDGTSKTQWEIVGVISDGWVEPLSADEREKNQ